MSAPFGGTPALPFNTANESPTATGGSNIHADLAALTGPASTISGTIRRARPTPTCGIVRRACMPFCAPITTTRAPTGQATSHTSWRDGRAAELAKMPTYYIMELAEGMAETVASEMPSEAEIAACRWLPEDELKIYSSEYDRTGFQGGLQWYRCRTTGRYGADLEIYSGRTIDVPSCYIAGKSDWGVYQRPGDFERMQAAACTKMLGCHLVEGAGHWVQQEQPEATSRLLLQFLDQARNRR